MHPFFEDYLNCLHTLHENIRTGIDGLPQEALDWVPLKDSNSLCVNVVHVAGAERYWIGEVALKDPSNRDRDAEFRAKGLSAAALMEKLTANETYARSALEKLTLEDLSSERTSTLRPKTTVGWALLHALEHTGLHLGHIQIQRQMWDQKA